MWCIAITWHPSPSVNLYILIFAETSGPIGTTLCRNVQWIVPTKFMFDQKFTKEIRCQMMSKWASIYMVYIIYCSLVFFVFRGFFFNAFLNKNKSLAETCITLLNNCYRILHKRGQKGELKKLKLKFPSNFNAVFWKVFIFLGLLTDHIFFHYFISKRGLKGFQIPMSYILIVYRTFMFHPIVMWFFCCWMDCVEAFGGICRRSSSFTVSEIHLTQKVLISKIWKVSFFIQFSMGYWWPLNNAISFRNGI